VAVQTVRMQTAPPDVQAWFDAVEGPGLGTVGAALEPAVPTDGSRLAVTALTRVSLDEPLRTRVTLVDLATGQLVPVGTGVHDRSPRWSPDGRRLAWLTDGGTSGRSLPAWTTPEELVDGAAARPTAAPSTGGVPPAPVPGGVPPAPVPGGVSTARVPGGAEDVRWAPDGSRLLVVVHAEDGPGPTSTARDPVQSADHPPAAGGAAGAAAPGADWHPVVLRPAEPTGRRSVVTVDPVTGVVEPHDVGGLNVWEAVWAGPAIAAVVSAGPGEESWYGARLVLSPATAARGAAPVPGPTPAAAAPRAAPAAPGTDPEHTDGPTPAPAVVELYRCDVQLGRPAASPSGRRVAVLEAFCSDRSLVAGSVVVLDTADPGARPTRPDTAGVDVTQCCWLDEDVLAFIGVRGLTTVAGQVDVRTAAVVETWVTAGSTGGLYPEAAWSADGTVFAVAESWSAAPHVVTVTGGVERTVVDLAHDGTAELLRRVGAAASGAGTGGPTGAETGTGGGIRPVSWTAPDGLEVEGLLVTPDAPGPHPLVLDVHGGPVWAWRNQFRMGQHTTPLLVALGFAVLLANPRGSSGRGQAYARLVERDVCGADTGDFLSALDHLVDAGIADPDRIGVTGTSYGGTMACWLPTQDPRFGAAVPVAGGTDWVSFHFTTDIPDFDPMVLPGDPLEPGGEYVRRSPLSHAAAVTAPVLHLTGARDTCVPVGQAMEFHRALSLRGAVSELVVYPLEGHGVHDFPAVADAVERTVGWFLRHLGSDGPGGPGLRS